MQDLSPGFLDTVVKLVNLGFAGVGIVVFLLVFVLLMRGKPVDPETARLRERMLTWGVCFAIFCGVLSVLAPLVQAKVAATGKVSSEDLVLAFSPRFETQKLPPPLITLPDGTQVKANQQFKTGGGMIQVSLDDALQQVQSLRDAAQSLATSVQTYRQQRDDLVAAIPPDAKPPEAAAAVTDSSAQSQKAESQVLQSIKLGDYKAAAAISKTIQRPATLSARAIQTMELPQH